MVEKITTSPIRQLYEEYQNKVLGQEKPETSFSGFLKKAIEDVNNSQLQADSAVSSFLKGEDIDIHSVMIAIEKADLNFRFAMQLRNKMVEAYQEVMRMQV
jgi:flagellar hook-basal body complex protein FliE